MGAEFQWPVRVYIEDTDAGGIVFYVNYLKYMERARTEMLRGCGYGKNSIVGEELMFVVRSVAIDYRRPARLDDELLATARIVEVRAAQLTFDQRIIRADRAAVQEPHELLCGGRVEVACVERQALKPRRIPRALLDALGESEWRPPV
jgi:tol-pal system-associated acyl-CoA thioesterase